MMPPRPRAVLFWKNFSDAADAKLAPLLIRVAENLRSESMPPEGEPRPDEAELEIICDWIDGVTNKGRREPDRQPPAPQAQSRSIQQYDPRSDRARPEAGRRVSFR